jgi:hypothetical protein
MRTYVRALPSSSREKLIETSLYVVDAAPPRDISDRWRFHSTCRAYLWRDRVALAPPDNSHNSAVERDVAALGGGHFSASAGLNVTSVFSE